LERGVPFFYQRNYFFFVCLFEWGFMSLQQFFSYIMTTSFSGGGSRSARIEPLTLFGQVTGTLYHALLLPPPLKLVVMI
jgi:hypothetical protein